MIFSLFSLTMCNLPKEKENTIWSLYFSSDESEEYFRLRISGDSVTTLFDHGYGISSGTIYGDSLRIEGRKYIVDITGDDLKLRNFDEELAFKKVSECSEAFKVNNDFIISKYNFLLKGINSSDSLLVDSIQQSFLSKILNDIDTSGF